MVTCANTQGGTRLFCFLCKYRFAPDIDADGERWDRGTPGGNVLLFESAHARQRKRSYTTPWVVNALLLYKVRYYAAKRIVFRVQWHLTAIVCRSCCFCCCGCNDHPLQPVLGSTCIRDTCNCLNTTFSKHHQRMHSPYWL